MALFATIEASFGSVSEISPRSIKVPALISSSISKRPSSASAILEVLPVVVTFGKVNFHFSVHEFFSIGAKLYQGGKQKLNLSKKIQKNISYPSMAFSAYSTLSNSMKAKLICSLCLTVTSRMDPNFSKVLRRSYSWTVGSRFET